MEDIFNDKPARVDTKLVFDQDFLENVIRRIFGECVDEMRQAILDQEQLPSLSVEKVAEMINKTPRTVRTYIRQKIIRPLYFGRTPMFTMAEVRRFLGDENFQ